MATIKSYTDLEQSKKLAKILPLESADMHYNNASIKGINYVDEYRAELMDYNTAQKVLSKYLINPIFGIIPCWSLVALFNVMPQINDWVIPHGHKNDKLSQFEPKICKIWEHSIIPSYKVTYGNGLSTDIYDNPVDAVFEMILKLHELGIL